MEGPDLHLAVRSPVTPHGAGAPDAAKLHSRVSPQTGTQALSTSLQPSGKCPLSEPFLIYPGRYLQKEMSYKVFPHSPLIPWLGELEEDEVGDVVSPEAKCIQHKWHPSPPGISCSLSCEASEDHVSVFILAPHPEPHMSC